MQKIHTGSFAPWVQTKLEKIGSRVQISTGVSHFLKYRSHGKKKKKKNTPLANLHLECTNIHG